MRYPRYPRSLSVLFAMILLLVCGGLLALSAPTAAHSSGGAPLRLRLKVEQTTLRSGQATKIWAEFLDGDYNQVPNDGRRVVEFAIIPPRGASGSISPQQVWVKPGEWSAYATFASGQVGRVLIRARSEGLDSDETYLMVTRPAASFLSQVLELFEPVAHAQASGTFEFVRKSVKVAAGSRAKFQVDFGPAPAGTRVRVSTEPPVTINYEGKDRDGDLDLTLDQDGGLSKELYVSSEEVGAVKVFAAAQSNALRASAIADFTKPKPSRVCFVDKMLNNSPTGSRECLTKWEIPSSWTDFQVTVQLADDRGHLIRGQEKRSITLRRGNADDPVEFDSGPLELSEEKDSAWTWVHLKKPPAGNTFRLMAECPEDRSLTYGVTNIFIQSPLHRVTVKGPPELKRGSTSAEFVVGFTDKEGRPQRADTDREINLSVTGGKLSQTKVTILKNQDSVKVQYTPWFAAGTVLLKAESFELTEGTTGIVLITPLYWLVFASLGGALIGGVSRNLPKGDGLGKHLPIFKRGSNGWAMNLMGSLIGGFIFYLAIKLGLSRALGFALPASFDLGTGIAALLLGSIGGYMGVAPVFDCLTSLWQRFSEKKDSPSPPVVPSMNHPAQP